MRLVVRLSPLLLAVSLARFGWQAAPGVGDVAHLLALDLPLDRLLVWLAGGTEPGLIPAPSRAAPLPLLFDWMLWRIDPLGATGLRLAHGLMAIGAVALLLRALTMRLDLRSAALAGLVIAFSPRLIDPLTTLGPDPFVLILFCLQLAMLLSRGKIGGRRPLLAFALAGAAAGLCGPGGMLAAGSLFATLLLTAPDRAEALQRLRHCLPAAVVWLWPLAMQLADGAPIDPLSMRGLISLGTRLLAHPADLLMAAGVIALVTGTLLLVALGLVAQAGRWRRNGATERSQPFATLAIATATGGLLVLLAGPLLRLHLWTQPGAQAWLGLLIALLAAAVFMPRLVPPRATPRQLRRLGTLLLLGGALAGAVGYHRQADWFAGPDAGLSRALAAAGGNHALVYAGPDWGRAYFPHQWSSPQDNEQWLLTLDGASVQRVMPGGRVGDPQPLDVLNGYDALVIARVDRRGWRDMRLVQGLANVGAIPPAGLQSFPRFWTPEAARAAPGEYWLTTQLLRRQGRP